MRKYIYIVLIIFFISSGSLNKAEAYIIKTSADFLLEQRKRAGEKKRDNLIQTYDVILEQILRPLYDAGVKLQFRAESNPPGDEENKTKFLPAIDTHFGNTIVGLNLGASKDAVYEETSHYDNEQMYATMRWNTPKLPSVILQYSTNENKKSWESPSDATSDQSGEITDKEKRITIKEDYTLSRGIWTINHYYTHEKRELDDRDITTQDLDNRLRIGHNATFAIPKINASANILANYDLSHSIQKDKEEEDNHDQSEEKEEIVKQNANLRLNGNFPHDVVVTYNLSFDDIRKELSYDASSDTSITEQTIAHTLSTLFHPHPYLDTTVSANYNNTPGTYDKVERTITTYTLQLEPSIPGFFFDPEARMNPIHSSGIISFTKDERAKEQKIESRAFLINAGAIIYRGVDVNLDLGRLERDTTRYNDPNIEEEKEREWRADMDLSFDINKSTKAIIRQEALWTEDKLAREDMEFDGSFRFNLIYRPIEIFMLDLETKLNYDGEDQTYSARMGWQPAPKLDFDFRYQRREITDGNTGTDIEDYFFTEMNLSISKTLRFQIRYQDPSEDQLIAVRFVLRTW